MAVQLTATSPAVRAGAPAVTATDAEQPVVRRAVFPARITLPDGTDVKLGKLFVTEHAVYVYVSGPAQQPTLVFSDAYSAAELPSTFGPRSALYRITTPVGELTARRLPGCGCHLRVLKGFTPWTPVRLAR